VVVWPFFAALKKNHPSIQSLVSFSFLLPFVMGFQNRQMLS